MEAVATPVTRLLAVFVALAANVNQQPCNAIDYLAGAIASEGTRQPLEAQYAIARGARNVLCDYGAGGYLAGLRVARGAWERGEYQNHHYRAYYALDGFPPALVGRWRQIAVDVLNEWPAVEVRHFGSVHDDSSWWAVCREVHEAGDTKWC